VRIRRIDQAYITLPNSLVAKQYVVNWSRLSRRQINFVLGVTYNTRSEDMRLLLQRLREMLMAHEGIDTESIVVYFTEFGDSALRILIRCYMPIPDWAAFQAEREAINLKIMEIVEDMELSIAFPSRSIYIENASQMWAGQPTAPAKSAPSDDQQRADT
jgi:MscS family membrane protein